MPFQKRRVVGSAWRMGSQVNLGLSDGENCRPSILVEEEKGTQGTSCDGGGGRGARGPRGMMVDFLGLILSPVWIPMVWKVVRARGMSYGSGRYIVVSSAYPK